MITAYIQHKHPATKVQWENISQDRIEVKSEEEARDFAKALAKHLKRHVRLVIGYKEASGIYYAPEMVNIKTKDIKTIEDEDMANGLLYPGHEIWED